MAIVPALTLGWVREQAARQERIRTKVLMGDRRRVCPDPIPGFNWAKRISMMDRFQS